MLKLLVTLPLVCASLFYSVLHSQRGMNLKSLVPNPSSQWNKYSATVVRSSLPLKQHFNTGYWKAFKNWNEGRAVVAENDSIVWVGTPVGLVRWNISARTYMTFDETNGLLYTNINALAIGPDRRLWITTNRGIAIYDNGQFSFINSLNSNIPQAPVQAIVFDGQGMPVVTCGPFIKNGQWEQGAICALRGQTWIAHTIPNIYSAFGPPESMIFFRDTVWISWHTLYVLANNQLSVYPNWNHSGVSSFAVDKDGSLWADGQRMTYKYMGGSWRIEINREGEGIGDLWTHIWSDPRGGLWLSNGYTFWSDYGPYRLDFGLRMLRLTCGTPFAGICSINGAPGQFKSHHALSDTSQFFTGFTTGKSWPQYSTKQGGLYRFNGSTWEIFQISTSLLQNEVVGLGSGPNGEVYLSVPIYTQKTDGQSWETIGEAVTGVQGGNRDFRLGPDDVMFTNHHPMYPNRDSYTGYVTGLDFDGYGNLWTAYPLTKFGWPTYTPTVFSDSIMGIPRFPNSYRPQFMDVTIDKYERVWSAAWYYGGVMFDRTFWHPLPPSDTTLPNYDYDLVYSDSKGRIWFGTNQSSPNYGFTVLDSGVWQTFYSPQRYQISYVYQIAEDHFGNVWLATGGGLLKYDGASFSIYDVDNSLLNSNSVSAVAVDLRNNIWVGTNSGLFVTNSTTDVEFGPYSWTSPADSLVAVADGKGLRVTFQTHALSSPPIRYQLQRARATHKFWTVAEIEYSTTVPSAVVIRDTSSIIGSYYYRIREVAADGKMRQSMPIQYTGGKTTASLMKFEHFMSGTRLFLRWDTRNEKFTQRFEVWRTTNNNVQSFLVRSVLASSESSDIKRYEMEVDSLRESSPQIRFSLRVVYEDSTRSELGNLQVAPLLPKKFDVSQNYPNPFNGTTKFNIEMPGSGVVTFRLFDILGREVTTPLRQEFQQGYQTLQVNLTSNASGVYFYAIESFGSRIFGKLLFLK